MSESPGSSKHIDVRVPPATHDRFYTLYHRWASGKEDDTVGAFQAWLVEQGERALPMLSARRQNPFGPP